MIWSSKNFLIRADCRTAKAVLQKDVKNLALKQIFVKWQALLSAFDFQIEYTSKVIGTQSLIFFLVNFSKETMEFYEGLPLDLRILFVKLEKLYIMYITYPVGLFLPPKSWLIVEIVDLTSVMAYTPIIFQTIKYIIAKDQVIFINFQLMIFRKECPTKKKNLPGKNFELWGRSSRWTDRTPNRHRWTSRVY